MESNAILSSKFEKVVSFIEWSEVEGDYLFKFQQLLSKQILITKDQIASLLTPFKMDHELRKFLIRISQQIQQNLYIFCENDLASYQSSLQTKILLKVNSLIRTSSEQVKLICDSLIFLHFSSCNMDQYSKSIRWFEQKQMYRKLNQWKDRELCVIKHKIFTVISIIYIKYNSLHTKIQVLKSAIIQRQKYLIYKLDQETKVNQRNSINVLTQPSKIINGLQISKKKQILKKSSVSKYPFENLTIYLRYKVIQGLVCDPLNQIQQLKSNSNNNQSVKINLSKEKTAQNYYEILILIEQYLRQVKQKNLTSNSTKSIIECFVKKMQNYKSICYAQINKLDENGYFQQKQVRNNKQQISRLDTHSVSRKSRENNNFKEKQSTNKQIIINKLRKSKSQSVNRRDKVIKNEKVNIKQQLCDLFFKQIQNGGSKQKSKSQKAFLRDRSKSKIMAKILANTFENAKNALRQIQFQIKTNNCDRFLQRVAGEDQEKKKLVKKRKEKACFYEKFNKNKRMVAEICKSTLTQQMKKLEDKIRTWNPISKIEENKKCIIEHKTLHKDHQPNQLFGIKSDGDDSNQSQVQFMKIIGGIPQLITLRIKPKDKNYILKFYYNPFDQQEIDVQISLPKSNNIFTGRYKTIWPTIKYLLRKKMMQLFIFKQNENKFSDWRTNNFQERNHYNVSESKLTQLFGQIDEDQLHQISSTLGLLCKFFDLLMCSQNRFVGRKYQLCQIFNDKQQIQSINGIDKKSSIKIENNKFANKASFLKQIKQLIWLNSRKQIELGASIIKQRGCKLNLLNSHFQNPFFIIVFFSDTDNLANVITGQQKLIFKVKVFPIGHFRQTQCKINQRKIHYLYQQKIVLSEKQLIKYKLDLNQYIKNIRKMIDGLKMDRFLQIKIMQICWVNFNDSQDFYSPDFLEIKQFKPARIISDGVFQVPSTALEQNNRQNKVLICENVLQFDVDQITRTAQQLVNNEQTHRTFRFNKRLATFQNKISRKNIVKTPSINQYIKNNPSSIKLQNQSANKCIRYFRLKLKDGKNHCKLQKQLIQINFLTPFNYHSNWLVEVAIIQILNGRRTRIVMSAQDFYSLGVSDLQDEQNTLKQLCWMTKYFYINKNSLIPKIIISIQSNSPIDTSIDGIYRRNMVDKPNENQSLAVEDFHSSSWKGLQYCKYRSVYLSKKYKLRKNQIGNNFETSGTLSQPKTGVFPFSIQKKRRQSNQSSLLKRIDPGKRFSMRTAFNYPLIDQRNLKHYLLNITQYQWFICTIPFKFPLNQPAKLLNNSKHSQKMFCLVSLKYINLFENNQKEQTNPNTDGIIQIQVSFSQSQYTFVSQIRQKQFLLQTNKWEQKSDISLRKCLIQIKGTRPPPKKTNQKTILKQDRRYSIKTKGKKKLPKVNSLIDAEQVQMHQTQRNYIKESNKKISFDIFGKRKHIKQIIKPKKQDKFNVKQMLLSSIITEVNHNKFQLIKVNSHSNDYSLLKCRECMCLVSQKNMQRYNLTIMSFDLPLKTRLYHEYDVNKACIFDVYMHSKQWRVGTGVNSGIGLGAQIQIAKIRPDDHFQIIKISRKSIFGAKPQKAKKKQDQKQIELNLTQNLQDGQFDKSVNQSLINKQLKQSIKQNDNTKSDQLQLQEIGTAKILDLIRQYKLEHVEVMCQLQPQLYTKNTILLTRLASYMMSIYVRGTKNTKRQDI